MKTVASEFFKLKKDSQPVRFLRAWMRGKEFDDIEVAIKLSSLVTHTLIQSKYETEPTIFLDVMDVVWQENIVSEFICGNIPQSEVKKRYEERFREDLNL